MKNKLLSMKEKGLALLESLKTKLKNITSIFKLSKCQPTGTLPVINVNAPLLSVAQEVNDE